MSDEINPNNQESRAISRYNAQKHAILRETITEYEKADAEQIYNGLAEELKPVGKLQEIIVETIASNTIRIQRIAKAEGEYIKSAMEREKLKNVLLDTTPNNQINAGAIGQMTLYSRYQTATENRIYRALAVLRVLQERG